MLATLLGDLDKLLDSLGGGLAAGVILVLLLKQAVEFYRVVVLKKVKSQANGSANGTVPGTAHATHAEIDAVHRDIRGLHHKIDDHSKSDDRRFGEGERRDSRLEGKVDALGTKMDANMQELRDRLPPRAPQ